MRPSRPAPFLPRTPTGAALLGFVSAIILNGSNAFGQSPPQFGRSSELPGILSADDSDAVAQLVRGAVLPAIGVEQLDPRMRPSSLEYPFNVIAVQVGSPPTIMLIAPWSVVARASSIRAQIRNQWCDLTVVVSSPLFDLAVLEAPLFPDAALRIADSATQPIYLFAAAAVPDSTDVVVAQASTGPPVRGDLSAYQRSMTSAVPGAAIVDPDGALIAIQGLPLLDRRGGSLMLPAAWILEWQAAGMADNPLGWSPEVREEIVEPTTGIPQLRPR